MRRGRMKKLLAGALCAALLFADVSTVGITGFAAEPESISEEYEISDSQESAANQESASESENLVKETEKTEDTEENHAEPETEDSERNSTVSESTEEKSTEEKSTEEGSETESSEETKTEQESTEENTASESDITEESTEESETAEDTDTEETETVSEEEILLLAGEGTTDSPYLITTEAELAAVANDLKKVYQLQNDITLSKIWTPVGTYATAFSGTFDGNGHTISGIVVNSSVEVHQSGSTSYKGYGFFGRNNGTVKNLTLKGTVTGTGDYSGLAAAYNTGTIEDVKVQDATAAGKSNTGLLAGYSTGTISGCSASGAVTGSDQYTGGLAGRNVGKITGCTADVTVSSSNDYTGGFAGANSGSIEESSSTGSVSGSSPYLGGFVGINAERATVSECRAGGSVRNKYSYTGGFAGSNSGTIEGSRASGDVEQSASSSGGFCGENSGVLARCLSEGSVHGTGSSIGGFAGYNTDGTIRYSGSRGAVTGSAGDVGGFAGYANGRSTITNCYANGDVTGSADGVGGFIGDIGNSLCVVSFCYSSGAVSCGYAKGGFAGGNSGKISLISCYYDRTASGLSDTGNGEPKTTAQMKQKETYAGWGFGSAWGLESGKNNGYPYLLWEGGGMSEPVTPSETLSGEGTKESPYLIQSEADLLAVSRGLDKAYRLERDIALSDAWTPVGTYAAAFSGTFDGNGHTISGIVVNSSVEVHQSGSTSYKGYGFFGRNNGTVKNLTLKGTVTGTGDYSGLAAAYNTGTIEDVKVQDATAAGKSNTGLLAGYSTGTISGCSASGAVTGSDQYTGGLAGRNVGKITGCTADVTVSSSNDYTGGFAGANSGSIEESSSTGSVSGSSPYLGGFVGINAERATVSECRAGGSVRNKYSYTGGFAGSNSGTIEGSRASGDVEQSASSSGGFCGENSGVLARCLSEGSVHGTGSSIGGFAGYNTDGTIRYSGSRGAVTGSAGDVGGFAGYANGRSTITNCYANGDVTGSADGVGGFIGDIGNSLCVVSFCYSSGAVSCGYAKGGFAGGNSGKISLISCYYDRTASGLSDTGNGEPKTTAQMKQKETYAGWGFGSAWGLESGKNNGYPYLLWEYEEWISVKGVSLTPSVLTLKPGESRQLSAEVTPENASDQTITWSSSNDAVVSVEAGVVTAVKAGTAKITVTTVSGGYTAECDITVEEEQAKLYTVKFETGGANQINDAVVAEGEKIPEPVTPVREGYVFEGWYSDAVYTKAWDFAKDTVMSDLTLYARWTAETKSYSVRFETNGGNRIEDAVVAEGEKIPEPTVPVREGYAFEGWYSDAAYTKAWDFAKDTVMSDLTLYARWTAETKSYSVRFETNGGNRIEDAVVLEGEKIPEPAVPVREGYVFEGWYSDAAYTKAWDFANDTVMSDMTLYARWMEEDKYSVYEENQRTDLKDCMIASVKSKAYDGKAYVPAPKVTFTVAGKAKKLVYGTDYRLVYSNNVNAGTGSVTVVGIGNYRGRKTQNFTISKKSMKKLKAVVSSVAVGDQSASPIEVYDGTKRLQKGVDYDYQMTASDVGSKGNAKIEVLSLQDSNYSGAMTVKVPVLDPNGRLLIHNSDIALGVTEYNYDGKAHKPDVTVTVNGVTLERNRDYSVTYKNNKNAGTAYVLVKGKGKLYTGTAAALFTIKPANSAGNGFDSVVVNKGKTITYNGKLQTPSVVVKTGGKKLAAKKDYVVEYTSNLVAGTGYVRITGINNYDGLSAVVPFTINPVPIKKASIKAKTTTEYTLKFNGRVLVKGVDYDVFVSEPHQNGKSEVTFTGRKNFTSSVIKKNVKQGVSGN